jgi:hypothetical protein
VTATGLHSRLHDACGCTGEEHDSRFTHRQAGKVYCQVTCQQQYNVLHRYFNLPTVKPSLLSIAAAS